MVATEQERFWSKVNFTATCWLWTGARSGGRYGQFWPSRRVAIPAHRWAYEQRHGPIAAGLYLDHLCRVTLCVRPDHLEPVTPKVNTNRGINHEVTVTHCPKGHPYDEENTRIARRPRGTYRLCRACHREDERRRRAGI